MENRKIALRFVEYRSISIEMIHFSTLELK